MINNLIIKGAKEKNLKNINLKIPKNKLIVFTGVSGSGKTSLAFSTIYNEGKRRYIESLSTYARQFLGNIDKPDVEQIIGLSPTIAINQKTSGFNPRSIVGTITEIYDYLRLLFSRVGSTYCINLHGKIETLTLSSMLKKINNLIKLNTNISIFSPVVENKKGIFKKLFNDFKKEGFWNIIVNGKKRTLDEEIKLNKNLKHNISILIETINFNLDESTQEKIYSDLEIAAKYGNGNVIIKYIENKKEKELFFSTKYNCKICNFGLKDIEPSLFSFNTIQGACSKCKGLGKTLSVDWSLLIKNNLLTINEGGIDFYRTISGNENNWDWVKFKSFCDLFKINRDKPVKKLNKKEIELILNGSGDQKIKYSLISKKSGNKWNFNHPYVGLKNIIESKFLKTKSESIHHKQSKKYLIQIDCNKCNGSRLKKESLCVKINEKNIFELNQMSISDLFKFIKNLNLDGFKKEISKIIVLEIENRLKFLISVGLDYLTLGRNAKTLSGGESQRIRLATQIGSSLTGIIYILDEPSIGLHQYDNKRLIETLKSMRDLGNTVIVVEHDEETILSSDWIVDIGKYGGTKGGEILYSGKTSNFKNCKDSITCNFINKIDKIEIPKKRRNGNKKYIEILNAKENNLKDISLKIPLNMFVSITGISGSGKSTLLNEIIYKGIKKHLNDDFKEKPGNFKKIKNINENIQDIIFISQKPIGKTSRSNPATYVSVFDEIRILYASTIESKKRGYTSSRFSFNVDGGRCQKCKGDGHIYYSMLFLPDVSVKCDECYGKRYNDETLDIIYKGKNIYDVLEMEVSYALDFFKNHPKIFKKLETLEKVGLGYIKLGQSSTKLSGGESQRIKLAKFLQKKATGKTMYLLDEPTTGLHTYDVKKLIDVLNTLVDNGETIILIEHNLDVIKCSDYIIDLGPYGGVNGGSIIASGTPEEIAKNKKSLTGLYLKDILKNNK